VFITAAGQRKNRQRKQGQEENAARKGARHAVQMMQAVAEGEKNSSDITPLHKGNGVIKCALRRERFDVLSRLYQE
jgi:hypothetical protein